MRGDAEYILLGLWKPAGENSVVLGPIVSIFAFFTRARTGGSPGDEKKKDPLKTGLEPAHHMISRSTNQVQSKDRTGNLSSVTP